MTIRLCINCKYMRQIVDSSSVWYNFLCDAPEVQKTHMNFVTGENEPEVIFCRDINKKGHCPYYRALE